MKKYELDGTTRSIAEWAAVAGVSRAAMSKRLKNAEKLARELADKDSDGKTFESYLEEQVQAALTMPSSQGKRQDLDTPEGRVQA